MGAADDIKKGLTKNLANFTSSARPKKSRVALCAGGGRG